MTRRQRPPRLRARAARPGALRRVRRRAPRAPVLLLHQTPRSWAEYRAVLPLLGSAIARSRWTPPASASPSRWRRRRIEAWAGAAQLLDALGIAASPRRGPPHRRRDRRWNWRPRTRAAWPRWCCRRRRTPTRRSAARGRAAAADRRGGVQADGSHLAALWQQRQAFYPADRPDLLQAFVADAMKVSGDVEAGHRAVASYRMEDRVGCGARATLLHSCAGRSVRGAAHSRMAARLPHAEVATIAGGGVPLPDQCPASAFARRCSPSGRALADEGGAHPCVGRGAPPGGAARAAGAGRSLVRMAAATVGHIDRTIGAASSWCIRRCPTCPAWRRPGTGAGERALPRRPAGLAARRRAGHGRDGTWRESIGAPDAALGLLPTGDRDGAGPPSSRRARGVGGAARVGALHGGETGAGHRRDRRGRLDRVQLARAAGAGCAPSVDA